MKTKINFMLINLLSFILIGVFPVHAFSQTILFLPEQYYYPVDYEDVVEKEKFVMNSGSRKTPEYWLVVSDRDQNHLYNKPDGEELTGLIDFKEYGYVIEERGFWVKIGIGRREENKFIYLKKSGWIHKKKLLLWPKSFVGQNTGISIKAFLFNKVNEIDRVFTEPNYKLVNVYDGPNSSKVRTKIDISNGGIYFIYKREGTRCLLGLNTSINQTTISDYILGWVDEKRIQMWDQRLALECNYDQEPYTDRKNNPEKHIIGFSTVDDVKNFALTGIKRNVLWDSDPVKADSRILSKSNYRRYLGEVFRFPIFKSSSDYIESAMVSEIPVKKKNWTNEVGNQSLTVKSPEFTSYIWNIIDRLISDAGATSETFLEKLKSDNSKFYSVLYLPKSIPGLANPFKTVVFMPASELNDYIEQLGKLERAMNGPSDQPREEIYNVIVDLMQKLSGDKLKLYEINDASVDDLRKKMNGLEIEGFKMNDELGIRIEDIRNKKVFNEKMLEEFGTRIINSRKELKKIRDLGPNYDFSYTILDNGNMSLYYWISTDLLF